MRVNHEIRVPRVRVISDAGEQLGVLTVQEALAIARDAGLDLVEVVATSTPPVCKIIDYGKFRYEQTKRERKSRKTQHQVKVKELKISPNISSHDLGVKIEHAKQFLEKGLKVKVSCQFRGREIAHPEMGDKLMTQFIQEVGVVALVEATPKFLGKLLSMVLAPSGKKKGSEETVRSP